MNDDFKKKKRTPGISPLIRQIKEITEKIQEINTAIQTCKDNIIQINKEEREISPKAKLIEKKQILFTELKNVNEEKESLINEKNLLLPELTKQKESIFTDKKKFNLKETRENILKRIASIENKIISTRLTPQKEKEFERELTELKKKKTLTENLKDNEKLILQLNERIENLKKQINEKIKKSTEIKNNLNLIKNELDALKNQKSINPKIEMNDQKISNLKKEKSELFEKKKKIQDEIRVKEEEYQKHLQKMMEIQKQENKRKAIKKEIYEKENLKNEHLKKIEEINPSKFDVISNQLRSVHKCNIPMPLFRTLASFNLPIPKNEGELEKLLTRINSEKENYQKEIYEKIGVIKQQIAEIDQEILKSKEILSSMPPSEISVRRGGSH